MKENKHFYIQKILLLIVFGICGFLMNSITAKADSIDISITGSIPFADHNGMEAKIKSANAYCVQRGYPFRSKVSDLQMTVGTIETGGTSVEGNIAANIRAILYDNSDSGESERFRGWGTWAMNGDCTEAVQTSTDGAPSSAAWQEVYDEDMEDDEDNPWENRYGGGSARKWLYEVYAAGKLTGHEGSIEPYVTTMKEITYTEAGFTMSQVYAQAIINYYCWEDSDSSDYSETTKYLVRQALEWGIQFNFISTIGFSGYDLRIIYKDSTGTYGISGANTFTGTCDGYIKTTIPSSNYEAMKLYRQVVWKTTNMRMIPSFSEYEPENCEAIKLYWDEDQRLYTTTVSDANGVLDYFDFSVSGVTCTNNGDGTLTLSTPNQLSGAITSSASQSKLEPEDGVFKLPEFYRWDLEGKEVTFKYSVMIPDLKQNGKEQISEESETMADTSIMFFK